MLDWDYLARVAWAVFGVVFAVGLAVGVFVGFLAARWARSRRGGGGGE